MEPLIRNLMPNYSASVRAALIEVVLHSPAEVVTRLCALLEQEQAEQLMRDLRWLLPAEELGGAK